nr:hypothetical protein [Tanacetum cinerariifolium]
GEVARKNELKARDRLKVVDGNVDYKSQKILVENKKESRNVRLLSIKTTGTERHPEGLCQLTNNLSLMAYTSSSSSSSSNSYTKVSTRSKGYLKSYETLKEHYDNLIKDFNKSQFNLGAYKAGLEHVEARLDVYKKNEAVLEDDIKILKHVVMFRDKAIIELRQKFKKAKKKEMI